MDKMRPRSTVLRQAIEQSKDPQPPLDALLTVAEACAYLRVSKWKLYRLIKSRALKSVKIGNRRRIRMESIQEFIDQLEAETGV